MAQPSPRAVYTLTGSGIQALSAGTTRVQFSVAADSGTMRIGRANPRNLAQQGLIRFGDATGWYRSEPLDGDLVWLDCPHGTTRMGYSMIDGASYTATEDFTRLSSVDMADRNPIPMRLGSDIFSPSTGGTVQDWSYIVPANRLFMAQHARAGPWVLTTWTTGLAVAWVGTSIGYHLAEGRAPPGSPVGWSTQQADGLQLVLRAGDGVSGYHFLDATVSSGIIFTHAVIGVEFDA